MTGACVCGSRMAHVECVCGGDDGWHAPPPRAAKTASARARVRDVFDSSAAMPGNERAFEAALDEYQKAVANEVVGAITDYLERRALDNERRAGR